jgi:streptogramin lyase
MAKTLIGLENDGIKTKIIFNDDQGNWITEDLKVGITRIDDLVSDIASK